jgi:hypothetical protein
VIHVHRCYCDGSFTVIECGCENEHIWAIRMEEHSGCIDTHIIPYHPSEWPQGVPTHDA